MSESGNNDRESAAVLSGALSNELDTYCSSDLLSEEGLRELLERHVLTSNDDNVIINNNYRFFRAACKNERVDEGIIRCLLEYFPAAGGANIAMGGGRRTPLHIACLYNTTRGIIQLLIDAAPASLRIVNEMGRMPLHLLCLNNELVETEAVDILKLLIEKHPGAVRHADNEGSLPIHIALWGAKSNEFCRLLIDTFPGSKRIANAQDVLPLHYACCYNTVDMVDYLYKLYPDPIHQLSTDGYYPIHDVIDGLFVRDNPSAAIEIVRFLLDCDTHVKLQKRRGKSLFQFACQAFDDSDIETGIELIKAIYDAHPEAIEDNRIGPNIHHYHQQVQAFINSETVYARQAKDHRFITTPDDNGRLPLHRALQNNVRLGSIKLLVKGNPSAIRSFDNSGVLPLHMACRHHESTSVVKYLVGLDTSTLAAVDNVGNTALHYACRGARHEIIAMLLETYDAVSVSRRNAHKKLPIDLLWESDEVEDRESIEYTASIFRLLTAYPETVMSCGAKQQANTAGCSSQNEKKRKLGSV